MFILSSISRGLAFLPRNHASMYENSESKVYNDITFLVDVSNNWPNGLLGRNVCKVESC